jgi:hypothetical protein
MIPALALAVIAQMAGREMLLACRVFPQQQRFCTARALELTFATVFRRWYGASDYQLHPRSIACA